MLLKMCFDCFSVCLRVHAKIHAGLFIYIYVGEGTIDIVCSILASQLQTSAD